MSYRLNGVQTERKIDSRKDGGNLHDSVKHFLYKSGVKESTPLEVCNVMDV